jgi:hypothetical protein
MINQPPASMMAIETMGENALDNRRPTSFIAPLIIPPSLIMMKPHPSNAASPYFQLSRRIQNEGGEVIQSTTASRDPGF